MGVSPPTALMYLSSFLKSKGLHVDLVDNPVDRARMGSLDASNPCVDELLDQVRRLRPDLLGMTLFSRELKDISLLCRLFKQASPQTRIVLGGPHPTAMPSETLKLLSDCDLVVRGEGELVLHDLACALQERRPFSSVAGIAFREGSQVVLTPPAEVVADLDTIPFPDRQALIQHYRNGTYSSFLRGSPADVIMTSRSCPFNCSFCFKVCGRYRSRSAENVLAELDWVYQNIRPASLDFMDDSFTIERKRVNAILDGLISRNYPIALKVRSRVNVVDEALLTRMKAAGVKTVVFGFESGSQSMLDAFNKRTLVEENVRASQLARKVGLNCLGDMILFYPGETRASLKETVDFVRRANPTAVKFYVLTPLPSTKVYEEAKAAGTLVGDWSMESQTPWVRLPNFKDLGEMQSIAKRMYLRTLLRPTRVLGLLHSFGKVWARHPLRTGTLVFRHVTRKSKY